MFGSPETTPGGRALKFYSSVRLDIRRIETLKEGVEAIGNRVRVKVVKNKVAPPFKQAEFDIYFGAGISWEGTVLDAGIEHKVVQKSGSYFSFDDERLGQGRHNATAFLREHPDVCQAILAKLQVAGRSRPDRLGAAASVGRRGHGTAIRKPTKLWRTPSKRTRSPKRPDVTGTPAGAVAVATRALARRELSVAELRIRLARAGFSEDEVEHAIEQLRHTGYQSDERTARERARTLAERCLGDAAIIAGPPSSRHRARHGRRDPRDLPSEARARRTVGGQDRVRAPSRRRAQAQGLRRGRDRRGDTGGRCGRSLNGARMRLRLTS